MNGIHSPSRHVLLELRASRRGTEVVITAPTRNRMGDESPHKGSNPFLSATFSFCTKHFRDAGRKPAATRLSGVDSGLRSSQGSVRRVSPRPFAPKVHPEVQSGGG